MTTGARPGLPPTGWVLIALMAAIDAAWITLTPLRFDPAGFGRLAASAVCALALVLLARRAGEWPRLVVLLEGIGFIGVAMPVLRLYNHLVMTTAAPLADARLAAWDAALGFDWIAYLRAIDDAPLVARLMDMSYWGLNGYAALIFLLLLAFHGAARATSFLMLFAGAAIVCSTIGAFFPAEAAMAHYRIAAGTLRTLAPDTGLYHLQTLIALRTDPQHMLSLASLPGLTTFPSFHTATGVIAIWCARGRPMLFVPVLAVNATMIASTPVFGSHYLVDVLAGSCVVAMLILASRWHRLSLAARLSGIAPPPIGALIR